MGCIRAADDAGLRLTPYALVSREILDEVPEPAQPLELHLMTHACMSGLDRAQYLMLDEAVVNLKTPS